MRQRFEAELQLPEKTRDVVEGYRPTLLVQGKKMFCNFDAVQPKPLRPTDIGKVVLRVLWDGSGRSPIRPGIKFDLLEGERCVGTGVVTKLLGE
jgi:hypothetical protein